jgi:manganese/iron transport system substrate-binding protein
MYSAIRFPKRPILMLTMTGWVLATGVLASCTATSPNQADTNAPNASPASAIAKPKVVATTSILCDMAKKIAEDTIDLTCLLKPGIDGHVYEPVPSDRKAIETAQLILYSGYDFEPNLIKLIESTSNPAPKIAVGELAVTKPLIGEDHHEGKEHQDDQDAHAHDKDASKTAQKEESHSHAGEPDPHVWQSAANGAKMAAIVQTQLAKIAPNQASLYTKNAQALKTELTAIDTWIKAQIATIPAAHRKLVTTHDAMGYFSKAYGIPVEGALKGISTDEKPTPTRVKELVDEVRESGVPMVFAETSVNPKLLEAVAKEANVKMAEQELYADGLGEAGSAAETYPKMLMANTRAIVEGLGGTYTPF